MNNTKFLSLTGLVLLSFTSLGNAAPGDTGKIYFSPQMGVDYISNLEFDLSQKSNNSMTKTVSANEVVNKFTYTTEVSSDSKLLIPNNSIKKLSGMNYSFQLSRFVTDELNLYLRGSYSHRMKNKTDDNVKDNRWRLSRTHLTTGIGYDINNNNGIVPFVELEAGVMISNLYYDNVQDLSQRKISLKEGLFNQLVEKTKPSNNNPLPYVIQNIEERQYLDLQHELKSKKDYNFTAAGTIGLAYNLGNGARLGIAYRMNYVPTTKNDFSNNNDIKNNAQQLVVYTESSQVSYNSGQYKLTKDVFDLTNSFKTKKTMSHTALLSLSFAIN